MDGSESHPELATCAKLPTVIMDFCPKITSGKENQYKIDDFPSLSPNPNTDDDSSSFILKSG